MVVFGMGYWPEGYTYVVIPIKGVPHYWSDNLLRSVESQHKRP